LYSFALYRLQDETISQDLVQETFAAALKSKAGFKGKSSEKTWLTGILKHKIIDFLRRKYRETVFEENIPDTWTGGDHFDSKGQWINGPAKWMSDPEQLLKQKSFLNIIKKCLFELPKRQARALALREIEGDSTQTICKVLNITSTNCWVILHRARSLMRKCIETRWLEKREKK